MLVEKGEKRKSDFKFDCFSLLLSAFAKQETDEDLEVQCGNFKLGFFVVLSLAAILQSHFKGSLNKK